MTNITNEQICEAIGWKESGLSGSWGESTTLWVLPDESHKNTPDFDNDMNAWFKWVVPWMKEKYRFDGIEFGYKDKKVICILQINANETMAIYEWGKTEVEAFKKAFTELVKGE